jgi:3-hydroxy acid dehydrogenase/malonic semialdehyde reductase
MIRVTHSLIDGMLARGRGHIVNLGSIAGLRPYATGSAYVTSKYAVHGLSDTLRLDYAGKGIRTAGRRRNSTTASMPACNPKTSPKQ